jgi:hypothetical protein
VGGEEGIPEGRKGRKEGRKEGRKTAMDSFLGKNEQRADAEA